MLQQLSGPQDTAVVAVWGSLDFRNPFSSASSQPFRYDDAASATVLS
jgi:hypothetical protein